jgi:hypothetical protein
MRDPGLPPEQFTRDQVLAREAILSGEDLVGLLDGVFEEGQLKLEASGRLSFSVQPPDPDLSHFNTICLEATNLSSTPLLVGVRLSHVFPEDCPGPLHVSVSGGREELPAGAHIELKFPRECFGAYGNPSGWSGIQEMEFTFCPEKHYSGPENVTVSVRAIYGELRKIPQGPRLTTETLETVLKQNSRGVADIRSKSMRPTVPHAELRLLVPPPHPYPRESAEEILEGRIMCQNLGKEIHWDANPLGFLEWTHFLNRHHFFRELVLAYVRSGDPRYAAELDRLIANWIRSNPVPVGSNGGAGSAWETLSVAWRLREWLFVVEHAWNSEAFRQSTKIEMLCSIWEHARSLMDHKGHPNNWIMVESASLALTGLLFPEFEESDFWVRTGIERLQEEFSRQFFRDGVHFEISPLYHAICFHSLLELKLACENSGVSLDQELGGTLERCADYLAALCRPDFTWPSLNDSGSATQDYTALMLLAGRVFERPDLVWTGSRGSEGELPAGGSRAFPEAGIAVMRSGYDSWANFLVFRAGPPGAAHIHEDVLSLDVSALGKPRLVDPGITTYAPDRLTEQYRSAFAHNTILVDGGGPDLSRMDFRRRTRPAGSDLSWTARKCMEIASGAFHGPWKNAENVAVFRTVFFAHGEHWIVLDTAEGEGRHEITVCWQFAPGRVEMDLNTFGARFVDLQGANLEIIPLYGETRPEIEVFTGSFRPPRGWVSVHGSDMPATSCAYHFSAQLPLSLVWILAPFSVGPTCGIEARRAENPDGSIAVELTLSDGQMERIDLTRG